MDNYIFALVIMALLVIAGAATHRPDIVMIELVWMAVWIIFAVIDTEAAMSMEFSALAALGAYFVLMLLPKQWKKQRKED